MVTQGSLSRLQLLRARWLQPPVPLPAGILPFLVAVHVGAESDRLIHLVSPAWSPRLSSRCADWELGTTSVPILAWPPFAEGILGGNVQVLLVAAFVAVFIPDPAQQAGRRRPASRDPGRARPAFKVSQPHAWFGLLRARPRAAVLGASAVAAIVAVTLPLVA